MGEAKTLLLDHHRWSVCHSYYAVYPPLLSTQKVAARVHHGGVGMNEPRGKLKLVKETIYIFLGVEEGVQTSFVGGGLEQGP